MKDNKTHELMDDEVKIASGGVSNDQNIYYYGDVYKSKSNVLYVVLDETNISGNVNCDYYNYDQNANLGIGCYIGKTSVARVFFKNYTYYIHIDNYQPQ